MAPSSSKQRLFPGHRTFQELCVVTQRAWRRFENIFKSCVTNEPFPLLLAYLDFFGPVSTIFALYNIRL